MHAIRNSVVTLLLANTTAPLAFAQQAETSSGAEMILPDTIVTASRIEEEEEDVPYTFSKVTSEDVREQAIRTVPDALVTVPGILVQKTAYGHGSPFIRGFTGRQNLLLLDGIRLNNSTWRGGPVQYWNTVDVQSIQQLEIVKSQGSVLYGSDAIGGTVNVLTRGTDFRNYEGFYQNGSASYSFNTNSESHQSRLQQTLGQGGKWGLTFGTSWKEFGDIKDDAVGRMDNTGYPEQTYDLKFETALSDTATLTLASQYLNQDDINRWHRTVDNPGWIHGEYVVPPGFSGGASDRLSEYYDQERSLSYARLEDTDSPLAWIDSWSATFSFQQSTDSVSATRRSGQFDVGSTMTDTYGLSLQADSPLAGGNLTWGGDYYVDLVDTEAYRNGAFRPQSRPLADDATYQSLGLFSSYTRSLTDQFSVTAGARYTYIKAEWDKYRPAGTTVDQSGENSWDDVSFNLRAIYDLTDEFSVYGGLSQAFRAPNLDDLTGTQYALNGLLTSGSPDLDPEKYLTAELGTRLTNECLELNFAGFYTWVDDAIKGVDDGMGGLRGVNADEGYVFGFEAEGLWRFADQWELSAGASWQDGKIEGPQTLGGPVVSDTFGRLIPLSGNVGLKWTHPSDRYWAMVRVLAAMDQENLYAGAANDTTRIPIGGTPGYLVTSLYGGWQATENLDFTLAVFNVTDEDYRYHGSGQNEPGFGAEIGARVRW